MRLLLTAGPTWEPIDRVRYLGNRSSGRMGSALAQAALDQGVAATLIVGPVMVSMPEGARRIDIETSRQMRDAVLAEWPDHDLLIMAAAVADYRPRMVRAEKLERTERPLTIELEPTEDILAAAGKIKRPNQRTVGFSLVGAAELRRSLEKLRRKNLDLLVHNPLETMNSSTVAATLLWPDGRQEAMSSRTKAEFADNLLRRAMALFPSQE